MSNAQIYIHSIDFRKFRMAIKSGTGLLKRASIVMLDLSGGRFGVNSLSARRGLDANVPQYACHDNSTPLTPSGLSMQCAYFHAVRLLKFL
jgi:hypothetical protein